MAVEAKGGDTLSAEGEDQEREAEGKVAAGAVTGEDDVAGLHGGVEGIRGRGEKGQVGD